MGCFQEREIFPHLKQGENSNKGTKTTQDFIQAINICAGDDFVQQDMWKRVGEDNSSPSDKCPTTTKVEERTGNFHGSPQNNPVGIKSNLMLMPPRPIQTLCKLRNKNKYYEFHEDLGHTTSE